MEKIFRAATDNTPLVNFDPSQGLIEIKGRSIPENAADFYFPLLEWLNRYSQSSQKHTHFVFYLEYINSISQKMLADIFLKAQNIKTNGTTVEVTWQFDEEDEEMYEEGKVFGSKFNLPINFVAVN